MDLHFIGLVGSNALVRESTESMCYSQVDVITWAHVWVLKEKKKKKKTTKINLNNVMEELTLIQRICQWLIHVDILFCFMMCCFGPQ